MKKRNFIVPMLAAAMMFFAACGDDNNNSVPDGGSGGENPGGNTEVPAMSPSQAKQSLQSTADELLAKINANEFDEFKQMFDGVDVDEADVVSDWFEAAKSACSIKVSGADEAHLWKAANFLGAFELRNGVWKQTKKDGDLTFTFNDAQGKKCVLTVKASDEATKIHHDAFDGEDWDWDYANQHEIITRYVNQFMLPKTVTVTLTRDGSTRVAATVNTTVKTDGEIDLSKDELDVTTDVQVGAFTVNVSKASYKAGKTAEAKAVIAKNGETLITVSANGNGSYSSKNEEFSFGQMVATVDILGKAKVVAAISDVDMLTSALDEADDNYNNETAFKQNIENANKLINMNLYLDGSANSSAKLYLSPVPEEYSWSSSKYWDYETLMEFSDGSMYSLDSYFNENAFKSVIDKVESIIDDFKDLFDIDDEEDYNYPYGSK